MVKKILSCFTVNLAFLACMSPTFAHYTDYKNEAFQQNFLERIYMGGYLGYGVIDGAYNNNGEVSLGRLALGYHAIDYRRFTFGIETGWQSGNDMILSESTFLFDATAFMPVQATLKPMLDILITSKISLLEGRPLFFIVKAGIAYRQLQLVDRTSSRDNLRHVNAEVQAGLGYNLTQHSMITAFYQGIYAGNNAGLDLDAAGNITISRIPTQQAGFLGIEFSL